MNIQDDSSSLLNDIYDTQPVTPLNVCVMIPCHFIRDGFTTLLSEHAAGGICVSAFDHLQCLRDYILRTSHVDRIILSPQGYDYEYIDSLNFLTTWLLPRYPDCQVMVLSDHMLSSGLLAYLSCREKNIGVIDASEPLKILRKRLQQWLFQGDDNNDHASTSSAHPLSTREKSVLQAIVQGITVEDIAKTFGISIKTVNCHLSNGLAKLGIRNVRPFIISRFPSVFLDRWDETGCRTRHHH